MLLENLIQIFEYEVVQGRILCKQPTAGTLRITKDHHGTIPELQKQGFKEKISGGYWEVLVTSFVVRKKCRGTS